MKLHTKRIDLYLTSDEEMERIVETETDPELKEAYREMLDGCLAHPEQREWYGIWNMELNDGSGSVVGNLSFKGLGADIPVKAAVRQEKAIKEDIIWDCSERKSRRRRSLSLTITPKTT